MQPFPIDFTTLTLRRRPNQFLMLPEGFQSTAAAHAVSPVFEATPEKLLETAKKTFAIQLNTVVRREDKAAGQIEFVQRSNLMRFPDFVTIQAVPAGKGKSALAIYSRSKYGIRDFGVNRGRVNRWVAKLQAALA